MTGAEVSKFLSLIKVFLYCSVYLKIFFFVRRLYNGLDIILKFLMNFL